MTQIAALIAALLSFLSTSVGSVIAVAAVDLPSLPLRIAAGEATFSFLDSVLP